MLGVSTTKGAMKFIEQRGIKVITINHVEVEVGSIVGVAKDIMVTYERPEVAEGFSCLKKGGLYYGFKWIIG